MNAPAKRTIAPIFWLMFGAGGMLSALFGSGLVVVTGFILPAAPPAYERVSALVRSPFLGLPLAAMISLFFWHGAERLFLTLKDMRAGPKPLLACVSYGLAAAGTLLTFLLVLAIEIHP